MTAAFMLLLTAASPLAAVLVARIGAGAWKSRRLRSTASARRKAVRVVPVGEPRLMELGFTRDELRSAFREPAALARPRPEPRLRPGSTPIRGECPTRLAS